MDDTKMFLLVWTESEIAGVKKFDADLNLGKTYKEAISNQLIKNSRKGASSYDMIAIEIKKMFDVFSKYGFKISVPAKEESDIKPKLEKHEEVKEG